MVGSTDISLQVQLLQRSKQGRYAIDDSMVHTVLYECSATTVTSLLVAVLLRVGEAFHSREKESGWDFFYSSKLLAWS
jgi:hypothetical protein